MFFRLVASRMPPTEGTESGSLLPTPRAVEYVESPENFAQRNGDRTTNSLPNLSSAAKFGLLPTPTAAERDRYPEELAGRREKYGGTRRGGYLSHLAAAGLLPTPTAAEGYKVSRKEIQDSLTKRVRAQIGKPFRLSPRYVAEMMGYPSDWTELPFQSGGGNP